jgi:hypothetical protein
MILLIKKSLKVSSENLLDYMVENSKINSSNFDEEAYFQNLEAKRFGSIVLSTTLTESTMNIFER